MLRQFKFYIDIFRLSHLIIAEGKNIFQKTFFRRKKVCCYIILWCRSWFEELNTRWSNTEVDFIRYCRKCRVYETKVCIKENNSWQSFEVPLIAQFIVNNALLWIFSSFHRMIYWYIAQLIRNKVSVVERRLIQGFIYRN